jgi:hypothetical protein
MKMTKLFITTALLSLSLSAFAKNEIMPLDFDLRDLPKKGKPLLGQTITIDTRKPETCKEMRDALDPKHSNRLFDDLCKQDKERPYATVVIINPSEEVASGVIYNFNEDDMIHANNGRNVAVMSLLVVGRYLALGIENVPGWTSPQGDIGQAWYDNVTSKPVIDNDDFVTNFIEHPISGAGYYTIARHSGFSAWESFGFSVVSSTFIWEYGLEAIFERPSINDLIVTPVLGSLLGELLYQISEKISDNDGKVLGSRKLGFLVQSITHPGLFLSALINQTLGADWFKEGDIGWVVRNSQNRFGIVPLSVQDTGPELALRMRLKF